MSSVLPPCSIVWLLLLRTKSASCGNLSMFEFRILAGPRYAALPGLQVCAAFWSTQQSLARAGSGDWYRMGVDGRSNVPFEGILHSEPWPSRGQKCAGFTARCDATEHSCNRRQNRSGPSMRSNNDALKHRSSCQQRSVTCRHGSHDTPSGHGSSKLLHGGITSSSGFSRHNNSRKPCRRCETENRMSIEQR